MRNPFKPRLVFWQKCDDKSGCDAFAELANHRPLKVAQGPAHQYFCNKHWGDIQKRQEDKAKKGVRVPAVVERIKQ